eukprot:scaffold247008_cov19-Tisochrysis_lutea.AAC.1
MGSFKDSMKAPRLSRAKFAMWGCGENGGSLHGWWQACWPITYQNIGCACTTTQLAGWKSQSLQDLTI